MPPCYVHETAWGNETLLRRPELAGFFTTGCSTPLVESSDVNNRRPKNRGKSERRAARSESMANAHQSEPDLKVVVEKDQPMRTRDGVRCAPTCIVPMHRAVSRCCWCARPMTRAPGWR